MTEEDKKEFSKSRRDICLAVQQSAERRGAELADEFTRLEVQVATILFVFVGFFWNSFDAGTKHFSHTILFTLKLIFVLSLFCLIASLATGLLHLKRKEKFWDEIMNQRLIRYGKWMEAAEGRITFDEAKAFHEGTALERGNLVKSPIWSWAIQTIFLALAIVLLSGLFMVFLFGS